MSLATFWPDLRGRARRQIGATIPVATCPVSLLRMLADEAMLWATARQPEPRTGDFECEDNLSPY